MNWITLSVFTIILYSIHDIILKQLSTSSNAVLSGFVINISAAMVLLLILGLGYVKNKAMLQATTDKDLLWMCMAGASLGLATITFMYAFARGGNFSEVMPLMYVGIIAISVITGYLLFKEQISVKQLVGIALSCVGIYLMVRK